MQAGVRGTRSAQPECLPHATAFEFKSMVCMLPSTIWLVGNLLKALVAHAKVADARGSQHICLWGFQEDSGTSIALHCRCR